MLPYEGQEQPPVAGVDYIIVGDEHPHEPVTDKVSQIPPKITGIGLVVIALIPVAFALILVIKELWR